MITILSDQSSIVHQYLRELRDTQIQTDPRRFEENIERIGMVAGYEASKLLRYKSIETTTPLGIANSYVIDEPIVLNTILRAGLPLQRGVHQILNDAELSFIAAGRKPETEAGVEIDVSYVATPSLSEKVLIIADTMIATGKSLVDAYGALTKDYGTPTKTIIIGVIASDEGIEYVESNIANVTIIVGAVDPELNQNFFIVPGLGDAGDLLYGAKAAKISA